MIIRLLCLNNFSFEEIKLFIADEKWLQKTFYRFYNFFFNIFKKLHIPFSFLIIKKPTEWLSKLFSSAKIRQKILPKETIVKYIVEHAAAEDLQEIYNTPNAVRIIFESFLNGNNRDSIYYSILFYSIKKIRLSIAVELLKALVNPDTEERVKLAIFQILMEVELLDDNGEAIKAQEKINHEKNKYADSADKRR